MNIPIIYSGITDSGVVFVGAACMDYDKVLNKNNKMVYPILCVVKDMDEKTIYMGMIKDGSFAEARSRIRKAMQRAAKKSKDKLYEFKEL